MKSPADTRTNETFVGCTIATAAAAPRALVLAKSFLEFHPGARFAILFIDRTDYERSDPNLKFLGLTDLDLGPGEEWRLPMLFQSREMIALLKPRLLRVLLKTGAGTTVYFEHTTLVLGSINDPELTDRPDQIVATPRIENDFGDYGRSFIGVSPGAEENLNAWFDQSWKENVAKGSPPPAEDRLEALESVFDAVPHSVITAPAWALGYANLNPHTFQAAANRYQVDGKPIRSFDFRGYDPDKPHLLSKYQGLEPRILLSSYPAIARLCDEYRDKVLDAASTLRNSCCRDFAFLPSGLLIDARMLKTYREALDLFRTGEGPEPPSPFGPPGEEGFLNWLNEPIDETSKKVTRYMIAVREEREDIKNAFPNPLGADAAAFRDWYLLYGQKELDLPPIVVPQDMSRQDDLKKVAAVNVAGYFRAELGLGVAARAILSALDAAAIPVNTISFAATVNRQDHPFEHREEQVTPADINIICVNPDQLSVFAEQTGPELRQGRYTIGLWFWEVEDFPTSYHGAFNYVDEIWVASEFMRQTFRKVSPKPVFKYLLPVVPPQVDTSLTRANFGLPDKFTFLFNFDLLSVSERKNPVGLIKAFVRAFPSVGEAALVIKTINGDKRILETEKLKYAVRGRPDIILQDGYLAQTENSTLTALADCYVSLHRSEGFGLTLAEAMALGKPVIATAYSGNLEFMTEDNSYLCPARRCEVGPECEPYPSESHWCEPDVDAAASLLRHVYNHREEARQRGAQAANDIRSRHSPRLAGELIRGRLASIRWRRARTVSTPSIGWLEDRIEELKAENARLQNNSWNLSTDG